MHVDRVKRHLLHEVQAHHHHAGDPEEDDVVAGDQGVGRIVAGELLGLVRPPQGRERPQRRGEPGVEHVLVAPDREPRRLVALLGRIDLLQRLAIVGDDHNLVCAIILARLRDRVRLRGGHERLDHGLELLAAAEQQRPFLLRREPVPGRDPVPPPELARDAPRLNVLHPVEISRLPLARHEHHASGAHRRDRRLRQRVRVDVPLVGEERLDHDAGTIAVRHHVGVLLGLGEQSGGLHAGDDLLAHHEAIEAVIGQRLFELGRARHVA